MTPATMIVIALTLYGEGASESMIGKRMIASVIWNRAHADASKCEAVCLKKKAFSCWNNGKRPKVANDYPSRLAWFDCKAIAQEFASGTFTPITDATHYHTLAVWPNWDWSKMTKVGEYGNHMFWHENNRRAQ